MDSSFSGVVRRQSPAPQSVAHYENARDPTNVQNVLFSGVLLQYLVARGGPSVWPLLQPLHLSW